MCPNNSMVANVWDFQRAHRCWLMHTITHGGCTNIVRKSTLKADSGRNPCRTRESNRRQYGAWLFGSVLHQLNGPTLICTKHMSRALKVMMHGMMSVVKPVLNWANVFFAEHTSDSSTNYNSFLNWIFAPPTSQEIGQFPQRRVKYWHRSVIHLYFSFFLIHRRALLSASQRQCSSNWANVPRTC